METNDQTAVNAKRFRKVAKMIRRLIDHIRKEKSLPEKLARESFDQIDDLAKEALIAPPRNCDVGTAKEQEKRFDDFVQDRRGDLDCTGKCPAHNGVDFGVVACVLQWAQMPYEEGGIK